MPEMHKHPPYTSLTVFISFELKQSGPGASFDDLN
jgi:hypothetical protein